MEKTRPVILASTSPRRKELLEKAEINFKVVESNFTEHFNPKLDPRKQAENLSLEKAKAVYENNKNSIIIAADTLVVCEGKILGKPKDEEDAKKILKFLNGKMHYVITGFTLYDPEKNKFLTKSEESKIYFNKIPEKEIDDYVTSKKPFDKAGAYGIQELPKKFIKQITGDRDNIIGLPLQTLLKELEKLGIKTS